MEAIEYGGVFVFAIVATLCTVAGIGGGAIDNVILMAFFKF